MIPLTAAADRLRLTTSSTANMDVIASYADIEDAVHPAIGRQLTAIAAATTSDILTGPSGAKQRTLKTLTARNRHATTANTVTLALFDGTSTFQIASVVLTAGEVLHYHEGAGFYVHDAQGRLKGNEQAGGSGAAVNALNLVTLAADVVNNNAVANTIQDVTGLSFPVSANETYWFLFTIAYVAAATTTGARFSINGPASPTHLSYKSDYTLTATSDTFNSANAYDLPAASNASSAYAAATAGNLARIEGIIRPSANGTVVARFASEVLSSAITAKAGSALQWVRTL